MKLKNKETGEIATLTLSSNGEELLLMKNNEMVTRNVKLSDLEGWEDVSEEPKEYWYIDWTPEIGVYHTIDVHAIADERIKEIGNYFETKEEGEKAVDKLKAWKRLKDKGFRFIGLGRDRHDTEYIKYEIELPPGLEGLGEIEDLDLLFGGEE